MELQALSRWCYCRMNDYGVMPGLISAAFFSAKQLKYPGKIPGDSPGQFDLYQVIIDISGV